MTTPPTPPTDNPAAESGPRSEMSEQIAEVLRGAGLTDKPAEYDGNMHSWRCGYPEQYGPCDCFADLVADIADLLAARDRRVRGEALREAADFIETTGGIGRRASDYADGWYDGLAYALTELRDRADRIEAE